MVGTPNFHPVDSRFSGQLFCMESDEEVGSIFFENRRDEENQYRVRRK